jgi:hypothetical protein
VIRHFAARTNWPGSLTDQQPETADMMGKAYKTTYGKSSRGAPRLLVSAIAVLVLLKTSAFAEHIEAKKDIKFGAGCLSALTVFGPRLGTCEVVGSKARIWCPNGEIFDRGGRPPNSSITRSICSLSQVLE